MNILSLNCIGNGFCYSAVNKKRNVSNKQDINCNFSKFVYSPVQFRANLNLTPLNEEEKQELFQIISETKEEDIKRGSKGKVYKVGLQGRPELAVKEFQGATEQRNANIEAMTLKKLPEEAKRVQRYVDLISFNNNDYLVSTFVHGQPLSRLKDKMPDELIKNILDELFKIEKSGLTFYDYSMANIVYENNEPGFFDFETAKEQSFTRINNASWDDLCHLSRNTYFPYTTNLAGFEIRTVGKIIGELEKYGEDGDKRSTDFVRRYLKQVSRFYYRLADLYAQKSGEYNSEMPKEAVHYSMLLARVFDNPTDEIISIEKQSMRIKELLTEFWYRNDPDLDHDDRLYSNIGKYVMNLEQRFSNVQNSIRELLHSSNNSDFIEYCAVTSDLLDKLAKKELRYLRTKI